MKKYTSFARFQLRKDLPEAEQQKLRDSLAPTGVLSLL